MASEFTHLPKPDSSEPLPLAFADSLQEKIAPAIKRLVSMLTVIEKMGLIGDFLQNSLAINVDNMQFLEFCAALANADPYKHFWRIFHVKVQPDQITKEIVKLVSEFAFSQRYIGALKVLLFTQPDIDFKSIANTLFPAIFNSAVSQNQIPELLESLWLLEQSKKAGCTGFISRLKWGRIFIELLNKYV